MTTLLDNPGAPWYSALRGRPHAFHALRGEPRVSYTVHAPPGFFADPSGYRLIVAVHGSGRAATAYRDAFAAFAELHRCVVLAPLFPIGPLGDGYAEGYKFLVEGELRYDRLLLAMIADLEEASGHGFGPFHLYGFSGGGQFAQRFFYLHPERLASVSIGAPGAVTRIDDGRDWWLGTRDMQAVFGKALDRDALRRVAVQMIVGDRDLEDFVIPGHLKAAVASLGPIGRNRIERLQLLKANFDDAGIAVRFDLVPGVGHAGLQVVDQVQAFFASRLTA